MNLANSLSVQTPELVLLRHTSMQTDNVGERRSVSVAIRIANKYGIWKPTLSDIETATTHGESETISEKLAYCKLLRIRSLKLVKYLSRKISRNAKILRILRLD